MNFRIIMHCLCMSVCRMKRTLCFPLNYKLKNIENSTITIRCGVVQYISKELLINCLLTNDVVYL